MAEPRTKKGGGLSASSRSPGFVNSLRSFRETTKDRANRLHRELSYQMFVNIVLDTPLDTGEARGGWNVSVGQPDFSELGGRLDPSGAAVIREIETAIDSASYDEVIFFSNVVDYIVPLEYGWSSQAPQGMVRINVARFRSELSAALQRIKK